VDERETERTLDLLSICSTSIMCVYLLSRCTLIKGDEAVQEVVACGVVVVATHVVREVVA
jgi:hypothetical protein